MKQSMNCKYAGSCRFLLECKKDENELNAWIGNEFCSNGSKFCARYRVAEILGASKVPETLFPTRIDRADEIIQMNNDLKVSFLAGLTTRTKCKR